MNFNYLLPDKPAPSYFKMISSFIGAIALLAAIYFKISDSQDILGFAAKYFKFAFLISLFTFVTSKNRFEDERIAELQLQIFRIGFGSLLSGIMVLEFFTLVDEATLSYGGDLYSMVGSILSFLALFLVLSKYTTVTDFIEKHHDLYRLMMLMAFMLFFFVYKWLWNA